MQYLFDVTTGRIVVSTLTAFLLEKEDKYVEIDLNNPIGTNKAAEELAAALGVKLAKKPIEHWLDCTDYVNTLTVVNGDPLYNYIDAAGMRMPDIIEYDDQEEEQPTTVDQITATDTVADEDGVESYVKPVVIENPSVNADVVLEVSSELILVSAISSYEEILDALAKNGYFIDNADGELDKVSKDLYGFKHNDLVVVLAPKAIAEGDDYIVLQSITLVRQVIDGVMKSELAYGASFGVACGVPLVAEVNEDVVNLHNKLLQTLGYTGQGNLMIRQSPDGSLVTMAGHLVSLTKPL